MKKIILSLVIFISISTHSQDLKFFTDLGYSLNKESNKKNIALLKSGGLGYQIYLANNWYVEICPSLFTLQFRNNEINIQRGFNTYRFIELQIATKKYILISPKSRLYVEFGLYGNHFLKKRTEVDNIQAIEEQNNIGYNVGVSAAFGLRTKISNSLSFDVGLCTKNDFAYSYRNAIEKIEISRESLKFSLYQKIKK
jgi:hypothetical protein